MSPISLANLQVATISEARHVGIKLMGAVLSGRVKQPPAITNKQARGNSIWRPPLYFFFHSPKRKHTT